MVDQAVVNSLSVPMLSQSLGGKSNTVDSRYFEPSLTRASCLLEPKSISPGFPSYNHCNYTLGNSNPR